MEYIIDTAQLSAIKKCEEYFPIDGVTTNPTIISREHTSFTALIRDIRDIIGPDRMFHIQTTGDTADKIVREAEALKDAVGGNFYIKIPVSPEGLKATMILSKKGIKVTMTAIFTQQQALIAAKAGASYVAPYVNRLDNIVSDGAHVVGEIVKLFAMHDVKTKVLAASFKNVEQIHKVAMAGCHAVTLAPALYEDLVYHPLTLGAIDSFTADWQGVYGNKSITDLLDNKE